MYLPVRCYTCGKCIVRHEKNLYHIQNNCDTDFEEDNLMVSDIMNILGPTRLCCRKAVMISYMNNPTEIPRE